MKATLSICAKTTNSWGKLFLKTSFAHVTKTGIDEDDLRQLRVDLRINCRPFNFQKEIAAFIRAVASTHKIQCTAVWRSGEAASSPRTSAERTGMRCRKAPRWVGNVAAYLHYEAGSVNSGNQRYSSFMGARPVAYGGDQRVSKRLAASELRTWIRAIWSTSKGRGFSSCCLSRFTDRCRKYINGHQRSPLPAARLSSQVMAENVDKAVPLQGRGITGLIGLGGHSHVNQYNEILIEYGHKFASLKKVVV
ncbi:hypothetical protein TNCV_1457511 [Trichonephila clavipes]|nr:hypothetical protein TNCV_1457511 [Trichonephila clavipes]